jgi:CubicO group peptidase (beta-lactamase class C family)
MEISNFEWLSGSDGTPSTASGLRMSNHDLAKIGLMLLNNGEYKGAQIVPKSWITESIVQRSVRPRAWQYGYLWWLSPADIEPTSIDGFGNGGQRLYVSFDAETVIGIFSGNYNKSGAWKMPDTIINEIIVPMIYKSK